MDKQEKKEIYKKLPLEIKNYLSSTESVEIVMSIAENYTLNTKQVVELNGKIFSVLCGIKNINDLTKELEITVGEKNLKIVSDIKEKIISKIEKYIPKIQIDLKKIRKSHLDSEKDILNQESSTPEKITNYISSGSLQKNLSEVGIEFDLRPSKVIDLKNEILFVLVGLQGRGDFLQNLNQNLDLPKELTGKIATYIDQNIFTQFETELGQFEQLHKEAEQAPEKESVPVNLPVQTQGEKIPTFSTPQQTTSPQPQAPIKVQSKPVYQHPQSTPAVQGLSQSDITENRPKPKPYVPPTRDFSYRDEKIGGVNIQKEETAEIEENINREDLLNDIENPVKSTSSGGNIRQSSYKGGDPYREPIE